MVTLIRISLKRYREWHLTEEYIYSTGGGFSKAFTVPQSNFALSQTYVP